MAHIAWHTLHSAKVSGARPLPFDMWSLFGTLTGKEMACQGKESPLSLFTRKQMTASIVWLSRGLTTALKIAAKVGKGLSSHNTVWDNQIQTNVSHDYKKLCEDRSFTFKLPFVFVYITCTTHLRTQLRYTLTAFAIQINVESAVRASVQKLG